MAAKRFFDDSDNDPDQQPTHKRIKTRPSLASVVKEVVMAKFLENFCSALEPLLRRVVNEEMESILNMRSLTKAPPLKIQAPEQPSLRLVFGQTLSLPIFTGSKITDIHNNHLQIILIDKHGDRMVPTSLHHSLKIEIVVLDGDFPSGEDETTWTNLDFDKNIVKERTGKRPLLAGDLNITMRDGIAPVGDLEFTDNSSWIRSRKFRIGARVVQGTSNILIKSAITEPFVVKDHRGELYKKHHPPSLHDEVWRLEKIGKEGAFHRKLSAEGINTVEDFLKLSVVEPKRLREILGIGMSEKMWDVTYRHAWTCKMGNKLYIARGSNYIIILNPACQVVKAVVNGQYATRDLSLMHRAYIEKLVKDAYADWNNLEEIEAQVLSETALLTMGDQLADHQQPVAMTRSNYPRQALLTDEYISAGHMAHSEQLEYTDWAPYLCTPAETSGRYYSDSSSDGDLRSN